MTKLEEIKHKHARGYYNPRGQDDVAHLVGEVERLTKALRETLQAWHFEAHQGDGFDEKHVAIYEGAKALVARNGCDKVLP